MLNRNPRLGLLAAITLLCSSLVANATQPQAFSVIVREKTELSDGAKATGTVHAGQLLTVFASEDNKYWVQDEQVKGWIDQRRTARLADAEPIFDALIRARPRDPVNYERRALMWWTRGETDKLIADYNRAVEFGSKTPEVYLNRGIHLATEGKFEEAIADYDQAIQLGLNAGHVYVNRGVVKYALGRYESAVSDFGQAIERGDVSAGTLINRASALSAIGRSAEALNDLAAAIQLEPENALAYLERGNVWQQTEKYDQARSDFDTAIRLDPKNPQAYMSRGFTWFLEDQPAKAIEDFDQVLKLAPSSALAYNNRGFNRQRLGQYREALSDYEKAVELMPEYALAHQNLAWLLATCSDPRMHDGSRAVRSATKACELGQWKQWTDLKTLAASHAAAADFEQAIKWQSKAIELAPEPEQAEERRVLALYTAGQPYASED